MKVLGVIPARIGSKGVPRKNLRELAGVPLARRCVDIALASRLDRIVFTADHDDLFALMKGIESDCFMIHRRAKVSDRQSSERAVQLVLERVRYEHAMLIQPTSPGLHAEDIDRALDAYDGENAVISVTDAVGFYYNQYSDAQSKGRAHLMPVWPRGWHKKKNSHGERRPFRDEYNPLLVENGAFYLAPARCWWLGDRVGTPLVHGIVMSRWRSVEIDEPLDFESWQRCWDIWHD